MAGWTREQLQELKFIDDDPSMFRQILAWVSDLGFEFCTSAIRLPIPVSNPTTYVATNYPERWKEVYVRHEMINIDPVYLHALRSDEILVWSDELFAETQQFWADAQQAGLRYGLSIPTHGSNGLTGVLSIARREGAITPEELESKMLQLIGLGKNVFREMCRHMAVNTSAGRGLTERERAVLFWTSEGMTARDIADLLDISERTVNFHLNNASSKLGVTNKTAAAVQAALLGLLL